jgi:SAM-dependent methyltransferase
MAYVYFLICTGLSYHVLRLLRWNVLGAAFAVAIALITAMGCAAGDLGRVNWPGAGARVRSASETSMRNDTHQDLDPTIRSYYEQTPEEHRLESGAFRLEAIRTRELIQRHLQAPPATVLDVGGAGGAYAFWLAELGYRVHLVDAVPRLVEVARTRNARAAHPLAACSIGDARALDQPDDSADAMLLLGPLYHLIDVAERRAALREAARVLRPGGVLIAAGISRFASILDGLTRELLSDPEFERMVERDLGSGVHLNQTTRLDYFTTAFFHRPEELYRDVAEAGFQVEGLYGIEGLGGNLSDLDERWKDSVRREMILRVARALESEPSVIGCSAHLLAVGRKAAV